MKNTYEARLLSHLVYNYCQVCHSFYSTVLTFVQSVCHVQIQQLHDMEEVCYDKVLKQIKAGHQVLCVFFVLPSVIINQQLENHMAYGPSIKVSLKRTEKKGFIQISGQLNVVLLKRIKCSGV